MHAWSLPRRRGRFLLATLLAAVPFSTAAASVSDARAAAAPRALAIPFAANRGQFDRRVAYSAATTRGTVFVTRDGRIVHSMRPNAVPAGDAVVPGWTLTESFVGGRSVPRGGHGAPTRISRFIGSDPARWSREEATYTSVDLGDVWPGVRVSLDTASGGVERIFRLLPGVSENAISVRLAGAASLAVSPDASLCARTGLGDVTLSAPIAWQEDAEGGRIPVAVSYRVRGNRYGFRLGPHDPHRATTIDPLIRATYLGGSDRDNPSAVAVNPSTGDILVAGATASTDFPGTAGGAQTTYGGFAVDGFVARLSGDLKTLKQVTYIGGSQNDYLQDVLVHPGTGEVVVMGVTRSTDLPGTAGGALGYGGNGDNFVARFNANLTSLLQTTYFGGSGAEALYVQGGVAVDATNGDIYISGNTASTDLSGNGFGRTEEFRGRHRRIRRPLQQQPDIARRRDVLRRNRRRLRGTAARRARLPRRHRRRLRQVLGPARNHRRRAGELRGRAGRVRRAFRPDARHAREGHVSGRRRYRERRRARASCERKPPRRGGNDLLGLSGDHRRADGPARRLRRLRRGAQARPHGHSLRDVSRGRLW